MEIGGSGQIGQLVVQPADKVCVKELDYVIIHNLDMADKNAKE